MINQKVRDYLDETVDEYMLFEDPAFDNSIIGVSDDGKHVIYDYEKMVSEYLKDNDIEWDPYGEGVMEAVDFIDYNTIRALNYTNADNKPIVMMDGPHIESLIEEDNKNVE